MGSSSKRFGLVENPVELDLRLQQIETEMIIRQIANLSGTRAASRIGNPMQQVTGIRLINNLVGAVSVAWNPVENRDISHYELEFAPTNQFLPTNTQTARISGNTTFSFTNLPADRDTFVRVRAVPFRGEAGPFSSTLNTRTGQATVNHLVVGSTSSLVEDIIVSPGFTPATIAVDSLAAVFTDTATFGNAVIKTSGGVVVLFVIAEFLVDVLRSQVSGENLTLVTELQRNGVTVDTGTWDLWNDTAGLQEALTVSGFATPDTPPAGVHTYKLKYTLTVTNTGAPLDSDAQLQFERQSIEAAEIIR